jgi:putative transcriptional regulator
VARRMKVARINRNLTQGELAKKAGVDRKTINRIENNHFSPNVETLVRVCSVLKISAFLRGI